MSIFNILLLRGRFKPLGPAGPAMLRRNPQQNEFIQQLT
jgi:hypothetical protein